MMGRTALELLIHSVVMIKVRGRSSMAERQLPKLHTRVRFPSPAPFSNHRAVLNAG